MIIIQQTMNLIFLFLLNILFLGALWHMDINHNLDKLGEKQTSGIFKMPPDKAYRFCQYILILTLFLIDILFVKLFF